MWSYILIVVIISKLFVIILENLSERVHGNLLCIVRELAGGGFVAVAFGVSER